MIDEIKESTGDEEECPICGDAMEDQGAQLICCDCGYTVEQEEDDEDESDLVSEV